MLTRRPPYVAGNVQGLNSLTRRWILVGHTDLSRIANKSMHVQTRQTPDNVLRVARTGPESVDI